MQENVQIGEVVVPVINEGGENWYPISYLTEKVLLKTVQPSQLKNNGYDDYIKRFNVDFGYVSGGMQECYCISSVGLIKILKKSKIGRLNVEQKIAMNSVLKYLNMKLIFTGEQYINKIDESDLSKHNEFIQDCIIETTKETPDLKFQLCTKCNNYFPYHTNFFTHNQHSSAELNTICKNCQAWDINRARIAINHPDKELNSTYKKYGINVYKLLKYKNTIELYKLYYKDKIKKIPNYIKNSEDEMIKIIKFCFESKILDYDNQFSINYIKNKTKLTITGQTKEKIISLGFINKDNKCRILNDLSDFKSIFNEFLLKEGIEAINESNVYEINFQKFIKDYKLHSHIEKKFENDMLRFIMQITDNKFAAYKFKGHFKKYWELKSNRSNALKYLIEQDLKLQIEKIPLYLTLTSIKKFGTSTMYNVLKKHYKNLFYWVNEVYPGKFVELDFNINIIRNEFDSMEEGLVHNVLKQKFKNVIYNNRNTENTINIDGMMPDWLVFTNKHTYLVEYFGLWKHTKKHNSRNFDYTNKVKDKIKKYELLEGYKKVYIFPNDLKDNMAGLYKKLDNVI